MIQTEIWTVLKELADEWQSTPTVKTFATQLPRNSVQRSTGLPGQLQQVQAAASAVMQRPLRLASGLQWVAGQLPGTSADTFHAFPEWLDSAVRCEQAHRLTLAWLRSRMPGYPQLLTPDLAVNGAMTTDEGCGPTPWLRSERSSGLQFQNPPTEIASALLADESTRFALERATRSLASRLKESDEWSGLARSTESLGPADRAELAKARRDVRDRLDPAKVDEFEPSLAFQRLRFRQSAVEEVVAGLTANAGGYVHAFRSANQLIESVAVDVFGELVCYRTPTVAPLRLEMAPGPPCTVRFELDDSNPDAAFHIPGTVAWLDDPLILDAVLLTRTNFSFDATGGATITMEANVLGSTADGWRPTQR